jgi:hypothetical protein
MSAVADGLNKLGMENTEAIQTAEMLVSAVTSFLSIYSAVGSVAAQLLSFWEKEEKSMQVTMGSLMKNCIPIFIEALQEELHKKDELERIRGIHNYVSESWTASKIALNYMADPNTVSGDVREAYARSLLSVNYLTDNVAFMRHFAPSLIFDMWLYNGIWDLYDRLDPGSNEKFPPPELNFEYRYSLPASLVAIAAHLLVLKAVEPETYLQTHKDDIRRYADFLLDVHNKIQAGITMIVPPPKEVGRGNYLGQVPQNFFYGWWGYKVGTQYVPLRIGEGDANIIMRPYGAVETYSGVYSIGNYPHYEMSRNYDSLRDNSMDKFYTKFHVRALKHKMAVYHAVGLPSIWNVAVNLKNLIGDPAPELKENLVGWSITTVANAISPHGVYQPNGEGTICMTELMHAIDAPDPIYCRDMLEYGVSEGMGVEGSNPIRPT